jgi:IS5 family transposase
LEDIFAIIFTIFDDAYGEMVPRQFRTNWNKAKPKLSDSEIMTIAVLGEMLGFDSENAWFSFVKSNFSHLFPSMCGRETYIRRKQNLHESMLYMREYLTTLFITRDPSYSVVDSMPMKACHFARAYFAKVFKSDANFGFCAAKNERYYGFKFHARVSAEGFIQEYSVAAANHHDTTVTMEICEHCYTPTVLGDKGYIGKDLFYDLKQERGISLVTPTRNNSKKPMSKDLASFLGKQRKRVEVTFSQLVEQFKFGVIKSKTIEGLACRVLAKVMAHNMLFLINQFRGAKNVSNIKSLIYN